MRRWGLLGFAALVAACSSGSGGGGSGGGAGGGSASNGSDVVCVTKSPNGTEGCGILKDLSPAGVTSATQNCQGTIESECPTTGLIGCCNAPAMGPGTVPQEICYYSGPASLLQSTCSSELNGTWSTSQ